jgi:hypothetical protein
MRYKVAQALLAAIMCLWQTLWIQKFCQNQIRDALTATNTTLHECTASQQPNVHASQVF